MPGHTIFVVDDEETIRDAAELNLSQYRVRTFASAEEVLDALPTEQPDLILMDIGLPGLDGVSAMERIRGDHPEMLFIMITAWEDVDTVVKAMKAGAHDYLVKPLHMDTLNQCIANALQTVTLRKQVEDLQKRYLEENLPVFIAESNTIADVMDLVDRVAASADAPVLITGETGTGKELVAQAIHHKSPNRAGQFVTLNCAAIPGELIESELFGYESGAFSGARAGGKRGLIQEAEGGTLFLDEVGDLTPEAQAKLLRFLDSGEFYQVGATRPRRVRTRVVSATNRDLEKMAAEGSFRRDLLFRLGVIRVEVPSLERRPEDILPLARHFLLQFNRKYRRGLQGLTPEAEQFLLNRTWLGNVRELKGLMERAVLTAQGESITAADLGGGLAGAPGAPREGLPDLAAGGLELDRVLAEVERDYLERALEMSGGNEVRAAEMLGLNYHTFRYRRKKLLS